LFWSPLISTTVLAFHPAFLCAVSLLLLTLRLFLLACFESFVSVCGSSCVTGQLILACVTLES